MNSNQIKHGEIEALWKGYEDFDRQGVSDMTAGVHHFVVYAGVAGQPADGTLTTAACGAITNSTPPPWLFPAHTAHASHFHTDEFIAKAPMSERNDRGLLRRSSPGRTEVIFSLPEVGGDPTANIKALRKVKRVMKGRVNDK